jgi:predicted nucleotidyltransferase
MHRFLSVPKLHFLLWLPSRRLLLLLVLAGFCLATTGARSLYRITLARETGGEHAADTTFQLTSHTPVSNGVGVAVEQSISASFDAALAASTVTSRTFTVRSSLRGLFTETATVNGSGLTLDPSRDFFAGEQVQVVGTAAISSTGGAALKPVQWGFTAGPVTNRCVADFVESGAADDALAAISQGSVAWGDYDNDGDLDILLSGTTDGGPDGRIVAIYRNDNGVFVDSGATDDALVAVFRSSGAWGDYDNDGDLDILLIGTTDGGNSGALTRIYRNDGGLFVESGVDDALPDLYDGSTAWGDYDNDGDLDILLTGQGVLADQGSGGFTKIYRNDNGLFADSGTADDVLPKEVGGAAVWGDYDNDGDLDILLTTGVKGDFTTLFRNDNGVYAATNTVVPVPGQATAWGDYDNDGDLDFVVIGGAGASFSAKIYRNDGDRFADSGAADDVLPGVVAGSVAWGDYDNDGDLDLLLAGAPQSGSSFVARIYRNDAAIFKDSGTLDDVLIGVDSASVAWGDYDKDGDLDALVTGNKKGGGPMAELYRNEECAVSSDQKLFLPMLVR